MANAIDPHLAKPESRVAKPHAWGYGSTPRTAKLRDSLVWKAGVVKDFFSIAAGLGGAASVTTVDVAPGAVAFAESGWADNGLDPHAHETVTSDVPEYLAGLRGSPFDLIVSDPPSFAPNGETLIYATVEQGRGVLATVSADGRIRQRLSAGSGDVREPAWSPLPAF